jgi:hypothetical protein
MVQEICNYNQSKFDIKLIKKMITNFMTIKWKILIIKLN